MPVTFLRTPADYFGIQEAPAQPLFQQTRALADPAVQNQLGFMDKVTQLRQQRPLARAQAMQNEYDTIFANADRLRMQQEAAKQAEQAVSALAGLTPEADDYVTQRQEIQRQFPSAMLDPRVQRIVDDNDRVFGARQSSLARQQQELQQRRAKLFGAGATPQQVEAAYQNPDAAAQLEYQLTRKPEQDQSIAMRKEEIDMLSRRLKNLTERDMAEIPTGKDEKGGVIYGPNPEYVSIENELRDREDELRKIYRGVYAPESTRQKSVTTDQSSLPPPAPSAPFNEKMKGLAGGSTASQNQPVIPPLTPKEELAKIEQVKDSPESLMAIIQSDQGSESAKREALKQMESFRQNLPNFEFKEGSPEQIANLKRNLPSMIDEARQIVELQPLRREVNKAWTTEKKNLESQIQDFAKAIGVSPSLAEQWLAKNETYTTDFDPLSDAPARKIPIREYFDEYLQGRVGKSLADEADILSRFADNKQAAKLGLKASPLDYLKAIPLNPRLILGPIGAIWAANDVQRKGGIDYNDVLDAYLSEKVPTSTASPQNQVAQTAPTLNIKNVRVKPPEKP